MKLKRRALSLNNVVSFAMELREVDELFEIIDDTADSFKRVLLHNGYYTTGPVVFRARPDSREFAIMTTIGNRPNIVGDRDTGFAFESHRQIETDFFHRHFDIEEPVPYADIERAVVEASARAQFHYSESAERFDRFASRITAKGYDPNGPFFYSLNNVPLDEMVDIEMFLPIRQSTFAGERDLLFRSYFQLAPLLRGIVRPDFESQTERVYAQLLSALEVKELEINSPFFHLVGQDVSPYACVFVGYVDPGDRE